MHADPAVLRRAGGDAPVWIVDPVDGTRQFVHGDPGFCTLVALAHRGDGPRLLDVRARARRVGRRGPRHGAPGSTASRCTPVRPAPDAVHRRGDVAPRLHDGRAEARPRSACAPTGCARARAARPASSIWPSPAASWTPSPSLGSRLGPRGGAAAGRGGGRHAPDDGAGEPFRITGATHCRSRRPGTRPPPGVWWTCSAASDPAAGALAGARAHDLRRPSAHLRAARPGSPRSPALSALRHILSASGLG